MNSLTQTLLRVGLTVAVGAGLGAALVVRAQQHDTLGYQDTPMLPGGKWHVHDGTRPQPKIIDPGTASTEETPGRPPSDAIVLFDGKDLSHWRNGNGPAKWDVENGVMTVKPGTGNIQTTDQLGDCQLHVEWSAPTPPRGSSQGRGNSGVMFFGGRYEVQVLDSFDNKTYPDGQAAAIYGSYPPLVNACRKPGEWQTYDIIFNVPHFDGDKLVKPGYFTVLHNGIIVQNHVELLGDTAHRQMPVYHPHPPTGPLMLQDHGNRVRYRNIWYRELKEVDQP
jgi:hypothetical protein